MKYDYNSVRIENEYNCFIFVMKVQRKNYDDIVDSLLLS